MWRRLWWGLMQSQFGGIVGLGVRVFVGAFGRNLVSVATMFPRLTCFTLLYCFTFSAFWKGNAAVNYIAVEHKSVRFQQQ
jgi:multisubunit Na+/H+ antiporter MnhE subunit